LSEPTTLRIFGSLAKVLARTDAAGRRVWNRGAPDSGVPLLARGFTVRTSTGRCTVVLEVGISRRLAAFHLDNLLDRGLLQAHYRRPPGRSGPGAGRSSKLYEPSDVEVEVTIPERRYDLAGGLLVDAIRGTARDESARDAALRVAQERGRDLGAETRTEQALRRLGPERTMAVTRDILERYGYEPYSDRPGQLALRNCPFHSLAQRAPELMCSMNRAFIDGVIRGLGNDTVEAVLACKPGDCCVTVRAPGS
jgi:predicted ArsR family transcriptional regulator